MSAESPSIDAVAERRNLRLSYTPSPALKLRVARDEAELAAAFRLVHDAYVRIGAMTPYTSGMRILPHHALPTTTVLVATWDDEVVGTASLVSDGALGLPLDPSYDVGPLRRQGLRLIEAGSLAVAPTFRNHRGEIFLLLLKAVFSHGRDLAGGDTMVFTVHPRWSRLYHALLPVVPLGPREAIAYDLALGQPTVAFCLDLRNLHERTAAIFHGAPPERNFHQYLTSPLPSIESPRPSAGPGCDSAVARALRSGLFDGVLAELDDAGRARVRRAHEAQPLASPRSGRARPGRRPVAPLAAQRRTGGDEARDP